MPKEPKKVAEEIDHMLRKSGKEVLTITWPEFYTLNDAQRWTDERTQWIDEAAKRRGLIFGFGQMVISVCHDRNFSPV